MSLLDAFLDEIDTPPPVVSGEVRNEVRIAIRTDGVLGSGTPDDPYNGATHQLLDDLLANRNAPPGRTVITENMTIRFGPGIFQTKGNGGAEFGFLPLSGQRFIGSGMYQTALQLVKAAPNPANGVRHPDTSPFFKPFDNMKSDGTLLRAYNTTTGLFESELADDVEDVYLAL